MADLDLFRRFIIDKGESDDELHLMRKDPRLFVARRAEGQLLNRINKPVITAGESEKQRKTAEALRAMPKAAVDSRGLGIPAEGSRNTLKPEDY